MSAAKHGDTVRVNYVGKLGSGEVFDSSRGREPLEFTIGNQDIIPGFESAVAGMSIAETKSVQIDSEQAYGPRNDSLVMTVERSRLPKDLEPSVGQMLQLTPKDGKPLQVVVSSVQGNEVVLDANHPLAGQDLVFEIELMEIVPAA